MSTGLFHYNPQEHTMTPEPQPPTFVELLGLPLLGLFLFLIANAAFLRL